MTTRSPTLRSFIEAAVPLFSYFVSAMMYTVMGSLAFVWTVMELSVIAVTFPMTCWSLPCAKRAPAVTTSIAPNRTIRFIFILRFLVMHFLLHFWVLAFIQESLFVSFFRTFDCTLWVELLHLLHLLRIHLGEVPDKQNQLPTVVVLAGTAPCGHSRQADSIVDDGIHLTVREVLRFGLAHVRRFRIKVLSNLRFPASVIAVAGGAMVREVGARLAENFSCRRKRIPGIPLGRGN